MPMLTPHSLASVCIYYLNDRLRRKKNTLYENFLFAWFFAGSTVSWAEMSVNAIKLFIEIIYKTIRSFFFFFSCLPLLDTSSNTIAILQPLQCVCVKFVVVISMKNAELFQFLVCILLDSMQ